jgi:hypothetical protein
MIKTNCMIKFLFIALPLCCSTPVPAQNSYPDPPIQDQPYYYDVSTTQLTALEKTTSQLKIKLKLIGLGGGSSTYTISGGQSIAVITAADSMAFVMSGSKAITILEPSGLISFYKLEADTNQREIILRDTKGLLGSSKSKGGSEKIEYTIKRDGDKVIFILNTKPLPGEYGILNMLSMRDRTVNVFCFHVQ